MADPYEGLDPILAARVKKMVADSGGRLWVVSGYRSYEQQWKLFQDAVRKYGSEAAARKWAADPRRGKGSNHQHGLAVDMGGTDEGMAWMRQKMTSYGLYQPMDHEPWHLQSMATAGTEHDTPDQYTTPGLGQEQPRDPANPYTQFTNLLGAMDREIMAAMTGDPGGAAAAMAGGPGAGIDVGTGGPVDIIVDDGARMPTFGMNEPSDTEEQTDELLKEQG